MNLIIASLFSFLGIACQSKGTEINSKTNKNKIVVEDQTNKEVATFAGGCFWCTEAVFLQIEGVEKVVSGYTGGQTKNPTYKEICGGNTGHAEAIQITFNPKKVSYGELLEIFFATHDPTTRNQQGNDIGTQYRSEIFYHNDIQKQIAEQYIQLLIQDAIFKKPIVTNISPAVIYYEAEDYHQNYYNQNKTQGYCNYIITPKIEKVNKVFKNKLKKK